MRPCSLRDNGIGERGHAAIDVGELVMPQVDVDHSATGVDGERPFRRGTRCVELIPERRACDIRTGAERRRGHVYAPLALLRRIRVDRKSTRLNSSHVKISYAVFCW